MSKRKVPGMQSFSMDDDVFDEGDFTKEDLEYMRRNETKNAKEDKVSWSTRHPRLSRFAEGCLSLFFFLAFIGGGICCIAAATTILVEGTKALIRIIGGLF